MHANKTPWLLLMLLFTSLGPSACGLDDRQLDPGVAPAAETGTLSLALTASDDIAGFLIEVTDDHGHAVFSEFVPRASGGGEPRAEKLVPLHTGQYNVTSTPMATPHDPHPECEAASDSVRVRTNRTTEVTLIGRCGRDRGAIDVTTGTNFAPEFVSVDVDPSPSDPCE